MKFLFPFARHLFFVALLALSCKNDNAGIPNHETPATDTAAGNETLGDDTATIENLLTKYDPPGRVVWQKPEIVIDKMGELKNKVVADIGAGSGFFSRRLAQQAKKVIAIEIDPRFIEFMDSIKRVELSPEYQKRFETRLAAPDNSNLKKGEADIVLIVNTYIYFENRVDYLKHLREVLPKGGKIILVDFKKKRMPIQYPPPSIRLELYQVENELDEAGFENIISDDCALDYQYLVTAEK